MWRWFTRRAPEPPSEVPDPLLGNVQRGVIAALGALDQRLSSLAAQVALQDENATAARAIEQRLAKLDVHAHATRALLDDHAARIDQAVNHLRGQLTGGLRGGRRDRTAEAIGAQIIESIGPDAASQLAAEISQRAVQGTLNLGAPNGEGSHDTAIGG